MSSIDQSMKDSDAMKLLYWPLILSILVSCVKKSETSANKSLMTRDEVGNVSMLLKQQHELISQKDQKTQNIVCYFEGVLTEREHVILTAPNLSGSSRWGIIEPIAKKLKRVKPFAWKRDTLRAELITKGIAKSTIDALLIDPTVEVGQDEFTNVGNMLGAIEPDTDWACSKTYEEYEEGQDATSMEEKPFNANDCSYDSCTSGQLATKEGVLKDFCKWWDLGCKFITHKTCVRVPLSCNDLAKYKANTDKVYNTFYQCLANQSLTPKACVDKHVAAPSGAAQGPGY